MGSRDELYINPVPVTVSMYCPLCGEEVDSGQRYCQRCGAPLSSTPEPKKERRPKHDSGVKGLIAIVVLIVVAIALAVLASSSVDDDGGSMDTPRVTYGDFTFTGGMADGDIGLMMDGVFDYVVAYFGDGEPTWYVRDTGESFLSGDASYYERPLTSHGGGYLRLDEPGKYEVRMESTDGTVLHGYVIVDGDVQRTWEWSRLVDGRGYSYEVEWEFPFRGYLDCYEDDAYRAMNQEDDGRFVVVDYPIRDLEEVLAREYAEVHGHEPDPGSMDYASYLLSFVQIVIDYPPIVAETGFGDYRESPSGSPDLYLYGSEEYWAYPLETLYRGQGDCEDTSFLTAALFSAAGYRSALVTPPSHMMVLVEVDDFQRDFVYDSSGYSCDLYMRAGGVTYRFCETTFDTYSVPVGYYSEGMTGDLESITEMTVIDPYVPER